MSTGFIPAVGLTLIALLSSGVSGEARSQTLPDVPVDLEVPLHETEPTWADGKIHCLYELHVTNFGTKSLALKRVDVLSHDTGLVLASYEDLELVARLRRLGMPADSPNPQTILGGTRAIVFLHIVFDRRVELPRTLSHRLVFDGSAGSAPSEARVVEGIQVAVSKSPPLVIGPPVRGPGWLASDGFSNDSVHRRTWVAVNGKVRIAQRFAIDFTKIGDDGQAFRNDPSNNSNWSAYGAEVLAVAPGTVSDVHEGIPENDPTADNKAVPINLATVGGNYVILNLGGGRFAFYAHLQPGSLRVRAGDRVRRGQLLALLGNSGNADAPHLHFHISDGNSPLGAEGVPFVFESFEVLGMLSSLKVLTNGEGWKPISGAAPVTHLKEMPIKNAVIRFR